MWHLLEPLGFGEFELLLAKMEFYERKNLKYFAIAFDFALLLTKMKLYERENLKYFRIAFALDFA